MSSLAKSGLNSLHNALVFNRRVEVLAQHLAALLPADAKVLDMGCGDGSIARRIMDLRPDVTISGVDVFVRPHTHIPVTVFDGKILPFEAASFDVVTIVDVLHHTHNPGELLAEAARVARQSVVLKDHLADDFLAQPTLRLMDWVGNRGHDVVLPYNYLPRAVWNEHIDSAGLVIADWQQKLDLYPFPASILFERGLHMITRLNKKS